MGAAQYWMESIILLIPLNVMYFNVKNGFRVMYFNVKNGFRVNIQFAADPIVFLTIQRMLIVNGGMPTAGSRQPFYDALLGTLIDGEGKSEYILKIITGCPV